MPTPTYTPLATVTLGSSASSVTFSSIPGTYRDLILVADGTSSTSDFCFLRFNGDSSNYTRVGMLGVGGSVVSFSDSDASAIGFQSTGRSNNIVQIMDYAQTDKHKTYLSRNNVNAAQVQANAHRYASTSAITSLAVVAATGTISAGSTFSLYGVIA